MTRTGNTGIVVHGVSGVFHNNFFKINFDRKNIDEIFLVYYLRSFNCQRDILDKAGTSTIPDLNHSDFYSIRIGLPKNIKEQTAIANALSDMDALLSELEQLIAKKQAIKTATMQQLLTGKTRLPQFATHTDGEHKGQPKGMKSSELGEIPEDWEVCTIADVSLVPMQNGLFYEPSRKGKGIPLINVSDMYTSAPISVKSLELFDASRAEEKAFRVIEGDLFFTRSSIVPSGIAYCNIFDSKDVTPVFDSHLIRVRVDPDLVDFRFIYLNCLSKHARQHLISNAKTATMTTIDQKAIKSCPVILPSKQEQTAIANILSDMDAEIQALEQRLAKTRQIKQGMMQELLTGKTRLPVEADD
jgi:type I restriction enzyme S subunit